MRTDECAVSGVRACVRAVSYPVKLFAQNYSTSSSASYSTEYSQAQSSASTDCPSVSCDGQDVHSAATFQDAIDQHCYLPPPPPPPQPVQQHQLFQAAGMVAHPQRPVARSRWTPQKQRTRESRRTRMRTVNPIPVRLEMSDLVHDPSGGGSSAPPAAASYASLDQNERTTSNSGLWSSASTDFSMSVASSAHSTSGQFFTSSAILPERRQVDANGFGSSRRHASSRHKSITVSASQFLQQQQTIAALIQQQRELKQVVGVLQQQQQQLMTVPVQLHELQIENAKGYAVSSLLEWLSSQVDSVLTRLTGLCRVLCVVCGNVTGTRKTR